MDDDQPWTQQRGETPKSYHAFCHYRDQLASRSVARAWVEHKQRCDHVDPGPRRRASKRWTVWSSRWGWRRRSELFDGHVEQVTREKAVQQVADAKARHLRIVQSQLNAVTVSPRVVLAVLQDPGKLAELVATAQREPAAFLEHLDRACRSAHATQALVEIERLTLGLASEVIEVEDKRQSIGFRIPESPEAVALASRLLDLVATGPHTAPEQR